MLEILLREAQLCYGFVRRDLGTGLLPVPGFALASLLYRQAPTEEVVRAVGSMSSSNFVLTHRL
jgi:hypothetical protein